MNHRVNSLLGAVALLWAPLLIDSGRALATDAALAVPAAGAATAPNLQVNLVNPEKNAPKKTATVAVEVTGVQIIDPATVNEQPQTGQGHLHYQMDNGPVIATTATKLSFHELPSGTHRFTVMLAANDHSPLGPQGTVVVVIP